MKPVKFANVVRERARLGIQMHANELFFIARTIKPPMNFLVFGMGSDSPFWSSLNRRGRTVFIEDQPEWFDKIKLQHPSLDAYLRETAWDVVLVDGPAGYENGTPGRMKSIYEASRLVKPHGRIFLHDQEREVEREYADRYLLRQNIVAEVTGRALLRHYRYQPAR